MREAELLEHVRSLAAAQPTLFPQVVVPPGDDCAVIRLPAGEEVLLKVDQLVEGRHFAASPDWSASRGQPGGLDRAAYLDVIARKAIARAVSDLAAMAGTPVCALAAACLPPAFPHEAAHALAESLHRWGAHWSCPVVGGDVASFDVARPGPVTLSISAIGLVHATRGPVLRSGARAGDAIYTTGLLGGSLGSDAMGRHLTFEPRVREARWLADMLGPRLHAMMDLSDGLGIDAARLGRASGVCVRVEEARIPAAAGVIAALRDGEDYELLFAAHPAAEVPHRTPSGCPLTCVGEAVVGTPGATMLRIDGGEVDISRLGWDHT